MYVVWAKQKRFSSFPLATSRIIVLLIVVHYSPQSFGITKNCPAGVPVGTFKLLVLPVKDGPALPLSAVNFIVPGEKLRYEPLKLPDDLKEKARVSVIIVPATDNAARDLRVLRAQPVQEPAEWLIPERASAVGIVFGPHGIDSRKVEALVRKHPEIVTKLADYAEQTTRVEALVQTLSQYEESKPDGKSLQSVLQGFSSQYGVQIPSFDTKTASSQQALTLIHALAPTVSANGLMLSRSDALSKTGGLASSVAASYFGSPLALAVGGAALVESLHSSLFPPTDFRSAFAEPTGSDGTELCTAKEQESKTRAHIDYLWMSRIPNEAVPKPSLLEDAHLPLGSASTIPVTATTVAQLASLARARDWQLVSPSHRTSIPAKVITGPSKDSITLDLSQTKLPPGQYQLAAKWDWTPFEVEGTVDVHSPGNMALARVTPDSQDALVAETGPVRVELAGTDFEFVDAVSLEIANLKKQIALPFTLPKGKEHGVQDTMQTEVDTSTLAPGRYLLAIKQLNGVTGDVPIIIHPPNPQLTQVPLNVNIGEPQQTVLLHGKYLERIEKIAASGATWELAPIPKGAADLAVRSAIVRLTSGTQKGDRLGGEIFVSGMQKPLKLTDVLKVVGPRPRIVNATKSFASQSSVELREGEIPAGTAGSFVLQVQNIDPHLSVGLACKEEEHTRQKVSLSPGDKTGSEALDFAGEGSLFLSIDPGVIGDSGCQLVAEVTEVETGSSDPFVLGRVMRLPKINNFAVTDEKLSGSCYAATLTGQDLQLIEKTGWTATAGEQVQGIPTPTAGNAQEQTMKIAIPWPPPAPKAPLYVWLRGESRARMTNASY